MISMDKNYQTRDGCPIKLIRISVNNNLNYPVMGVVTNKDEIEAHLTWTREGQFCLNVPQSQTDLVEIKEEHT